MAAKVSRRRFVALLSATGLVALLAEKRIPHAGIRIDRQAARAIGNAYLEHHPAEKSGLRLRLALADVDAQNVSDIVQRDFAAGRIVYVDGWALARTEARLCALVAMS